MPMMWSLLRTLARVAGIRPRFRPATVIHFRPYALR
jgi:hypothetical protein